MWPILIYHFCRYFEELQEDLARVREDELELRRRAGPPTDIFGNHVGTQSSAWGDIRQSTMSDDLFLPFENLITPEVPSQSLSRVFGEIFLNYYTDYRFLKSTLLHK